MDTKNIGLNKVSFGTKPLIGDIAATTGLSKYKPSLSTGIYNAFKDLSKNGINDDVIFNIGIKKGAKRLTTDVIEIGYSPDSSKKPIKSSTKLSPKSLEKKSAKEIKNIILNAYEKLKTSNKNTRAIADYPLKGTTRPTKKQQKTIQNLTNEFGYDDWTCA